MWFVFSSCPIGGRNHPEDPSRTEKTQKMLIEGEVYFLYTVVNFLLSLHLFPYFQVVRNDFVPYLDNNTDPTFLTAEFTGTRGEAATATGERTPEGGSQSCKAEAERGGSQTKGGERKGKTRKKREGREGKGRKVKSKRGAAEIQARVSDADFS